MFHCRLALVCVLAGFVWHTPALAWGHPGHQLVGSLADELIMGTNASKKVAAILGPQIRSLQTAATWPDCVRDVQRSSSGTFKYNDHSMYHSPACVPFEGAAERKRMEEFARRNWTNCPGEQGKPASECHKQFHFADVAVQHRDYKRTWAGTSDLDVVSAIQAAIGVLRNGPPATAPFSIKTKKEALFMLAHFVGDLHQPLHVGAIYLADDGSVVNPDSGSIPLAEVMQTRGGNKLEIGVSNLHSEWDDIPSSITLNGLKTGPGKKRRQAMIAAARAVEGMTGDLTLWPVTWASDTVTVAQNSFTGLRFSRKGVLKSGNWVVQFNDQTGYDNAKERVQQQQLVKAAANLAQLLKAIWP
nr:S1/P1 nuclease [Aquabacterium sp.]